MPNIPGAQNILPGVVTDVVTQSRGSATNIGSRLPAIIGEGKSEFTIVSNANGIGRDGLNPSYTSYTGQDGRHFMLPTYPVAAGRTEVYKNGSLLSGTEGTITGDAFLQKYDYKFDPTTGRLELQTANFKDQGGSLYSVGANTKGVGTITDLELLDQNAVAEKWLIKCTSVQRTSGSTPIAKTAKFMAYGSLTGARLDSNGNPYIWISDGYAVSNGTLKFSISETLSAAKPFEPGDSFVIYIESGVLNRGDSLTVSTIVESYLEAPTVYTSMDDIVKDHGQPSADNTLSLGAQLAFANGAPAIMAVQAKPSLARRTSQVLTTSFNYDLSDSDNFKFPLESQPDADFNINFFITGAAANSVEAQVQPNKVAFETISTAQEITDFINSATQQPGGAAYCYTVVSSDLSIESGQNGTITRQSDDMTADGYSYGWFSVSGINYDSTYVGKSLKIIAAVNTSNNSGDTTLFNIYAVSPGKLWFQIDNFTDFTTVSGGGIAFELVNKSTGIAVSGYSSTGADGYDGYLTEAGVLAKFDSARTFGNISGFATGFSNYRLRITGGSVDTGLFDITGYNSGDDTLTIRKTIVTESNVRYEIIDSDNTGYYVLLNKSIAKEGESVRVSYVNTVDASFYDAGWLSALESLEKVECDIVVPLPKQTMSAIFQNTLQHCKAMSSLRNRRERVLFTGAIAGLKAANLVTGGTPIAVEDVGVLEGIQGDTPDEIAAGQVEDITDYSVPNSFGNTFRAVYMFPDQIIVNVGENIIVDGFYQAAAHAGYLAGVPKIQAPSTNKSLVGYKIPNTKAMSQTTLETLAAAGVCVCTPSAAGGNIVWGLTTTQSGVAEEQEISIIFIRDNLAKGARASCKRFIGNEESSTTEADLTVAMTEYLGGATSQGLITRFKDLTVKRDSLEPRQWNIGFTVQPTYGINWIYIKFNVGYFGE